METGPSLGARKTQTKTTMERSLSAVILTHPALTRVAGNEEFLHVAHRDGNRYHQFGK